MKKIPRAGLILLMTAALVYSCKEGVSSEENTVMEESVSSNTDNNKVVSSSSAVEPKNSSRKFIRTADIKFKVKNVAKSTYAIEDATTKFGGFVTYTNLQSNASEKEETKVSQDSTLITTKYAVTNDITIRVPNTNMQ